MSFETMPEMKARHRAERIGAIKALNAQGLTRSEAARRLKVTLQHLYFVTRTEGIAWNHYDERTKGRYQRSTQKGTDHAKTSLRRREGGEEQPQAPKEEPTEGRPPRPSCAAPRDILSPEAGRGRNHAADP